jgi:hypothetical protein
LSSRNTVYLNRHRIYNRKYVHKNNRIVIGNNIDTMVKYIAVLLFDISALFSAQYYIKSKK